LPFQIADPQKAVPPIHESIMIIDSENKTGNNEIEKKVVILSKRPADVECFNLLVKSLRPLKPA
jgi:hypothetical protein